MDLNLNLESQIKNLNKILDTKNEQSQQWRELNKELQKDIRKQKLKTKLTGGAGILLAIGAAVLIN